MSAETGGDAQALFHTLVRNVLAPLVRAHGYKGSGTTYRHRGHDGAWTIVNLQRWRGSTRDEVRFAVNLAATSEHLRHMTSG